MAERLNGFFELIIASFILPWFTRISPSRAFPNAVETLLRSFLTDIVRLAEQVDWSALLVSRIIPIITEHIHHYRSVEHLSSSTTTSAPNTSLPLPLPPRPHPALARQDHVPVGIASPFIEAHLREWLRRVLERSLPEKDRSEVVLTIAREITLGAVLLPSFDMLCDSDFWNRQIEEKGGRYLHEQ
jgi:sorting nexin-25